MTREIWNKVLTSLQSHVNKQSFDIWLKETEPISITDDIIKIKVIDDVAGRHISERYSQQIDSIIESITGQKYKCEFVSENGFTSDKENIISADSTALGEKFNKLKPAKGEMPLNPKYSFDNFVVGPNNQLAHAAAYSVAQYPATQYNPLFIYGDSGLGKTHLLQAIAHFINKEKPFLNVLFVSTDQFITEFINSIGSSTQESFKIKYRNVDILLIDDIQFIEKKEGTQNEFFHTFNTLHQNKKQVVISSDRPPKKIAPLADRLRTRFEGGMLTDVQSPNIETREAILRNKAVKENLNISDEALSYIAKRIKSNIRALEAALNRLQMVSSLFNEKIVINHAKTHLRDLFDDDTDKKVTIADIMVKISEKNNVTVNELTSKSRHSRIIQPRFIAMYIARKLTGLTTIDIGKAFGDRDHSTVLNALNKIEEDMKNDYDLKESVDDLIVELKS